MISPLPSHPILAFAEPVGIYRRCKVCYGLTTWRRPQHLAASPTRLPLSQQEAALSLPRGAVVSKSEADEAQRANCPEGSFLDHHRRACLRACECGRGLSAQRWSGQSHSVLCQCVISVCAAAKPEASSDSRCNRHGGQQGIPEHERLVRNRG